MENQMKIVCEIKISGVDTLVAMTTAPNLDIPAFLKLKPGVGKPYFVWDSIPYPNPTTCDFTNAPIVSSDVAVNAANIAAITIEPEDVLTWT